MTRTASLFALAIALPGVAARAGAAELRSATLDKWQSYLVGADARMQARLDNDKPFLWTDEAAGRAARVRRGEIVVAPLVGHGTQTVPNGLIHDWIGAVFIPDATIENLLAVLHDYDRYKEIYTPAVTGSRSLETNATDQQYSMTWHSHVLYVNAAVRGNYRAHDFIIDSQRGYSVNDATRIQQIEDYRLPTEHLLPPDTGSGFIWRMHAISRYQERDGGVYLEVEAIALTRDIPMSLRWLVRPIVNHLSVNSLTTTLSQTRAAAGSQRVRLALRKSKDAK